MIETRFTGAGSNFAWVVPLPSQPVVEAASTGLFPTLQYYFQPPITHNVPRFYLGIAVVIGLLLFLRYLIKTCSGPVAAVTPCAVVVGGGLVASSSVNRQITGGGGFGDSGFNRVGFGSTTGRHV